jgi:site-specific recombinase XerD
LFRNVHGNPWTRNAVTQRFEHIRSRLGLGPEASAYSFRHLFATTALESGVQIATVAELMGHRDTTMVSRIYSHLAGRATHLKHALANVRPEPAMDRGE